MAEKMQPHTSGRQLIIIYFVLLVLNILVLLIGNFLFPRAVVLGTINITYWWAIAHSMGKLSLLGIIFIPIIEYWATKKGKVLTSRDWMISYLIINFGGLWVISRFSEQFGLGLSAWWVVLILAGVMDLVQGAGITWVYKKYKE